MPAITIKKIYRLPIKTHAIRSAYKFFRHTPHGRYIKEIARILLLTIYSTESAADSLRSTATQLVGDHDPCLLFTGDATYISQGIIMPLEKRRVDTRIPEQFFEDPWDRRNGFVDTAQLFNVEIGSFHPISRQDERLRNKQGIWNWLTFTIGDKIPLEQLAIYSVESWNTNPGSKRDLSKFVRDAGPFGLTSIQTISKRKDDPLLSDTYLFENQEGDLTSVISCSTPKNAPYPTCQHWFRAAELDVEMSYRRTELANWNSLQHDVTTFLICATSSNL